MVSWEGGVAGRVGECTWERGRPGGGFGRDRGREAIRGKR